MNIAWNDVQGWGRLGALALLGVACVAAGCTATGARTSTRGAEGSEARSQTLELPTSASPAPELAPLAFLAGQWVGINAAGTVNEEVWTAPRGRSLAGLFRQVRKDSKPAFHEVSVISVEDDGSVLLRLRHLHAKLEVPAKRAEPTVLKLVQADETSATFASLPGEAEPITVTYRLEDANTLSNTVTPAAGSKQQPYTIRSTRVREGR